jgi:hypothetical protein
MTTSQPPPMLSDDNYLVPTLSLRIAARNSLTLTSADEIVIKCQEKTTRKFWGRTGGSNAMMNSDRPSCRPATLGVKRFRPHRLRGLLEPSRPTTGFKK